MRGSLIAIAAFSALAFVAVLLQIRSVENGARVVPVARRVGAAAKASHLTVPSGAVARRRLAGSPAPLAALHRQAGELIEGESLDTRLERLRGHPVVLNVWASWCPPCRAELPLFATVSAAQGKRVAFLGADVDDRPEDARRMLAAERLSYPSYATGAGELDAIAQVHGTPFTVFLDRRGEVADVHVGAYESRSALAGDVRSLPAQAGGTG